MGWRSQVLLYTATNAIGGGIVAAIGPSIEEFARTTGMNESQLGSAVMLNRGVKMLGLLVWTAYAQALQTGSARVPPRAVMAATMLLTMCAALFLAHVASTSALMLRLSLALFGLCYGLFDAGSMQLALWCSDTPDSKRTALAAVSAGYGTAATLAPTLIAISLRLGGSAYHCFDALAVLSALVCTCYLCAKPLPIARRRVASAPT